MARQIDLRVPKIVENIFPMYKTIAVGVFYFLVPVYPFNTHCYPIYKNLKFIGRHEVAMTQPM